MTPTDLERRGGRALLDYTAALVLCSPTETTPIVARPFHVSIVEKLALLQL